ncbi:MAG TPA: phosphohydrolase, partial [Anaeromyxobacteraceae bacterium]|nr:phosphohydrolase [Anaeromyxobacteraceae bacterium]
AAEGGEVPHAEGAPAPHPERADRPPRPERRDRPDRGGPRAFGDRKKGYMGPRLPGDKGPGSYRPSEKKALTHNPFAALAAKLDEVGKGPAHEEPGPEAPPAEAAEGEAPEAPPAETAAVTPVVGEVAPAEPAPAPTEGAAEEKAGEGA